MENLNRITTVLGLIIAVMIAGTQLYTSTTAIGVAYQFQSEHESFARLGRAEKGFGDGLEIGGIEDGGRQKFGFVALSRIDQFHDFRVVRVKDRLRVSSLLEAGETPPQPELLEAFAMAKAAKLAQAECAVLMQRLASACELSDARGKDEGGGRVSVSFALRFIQRDGFGQIKADKKAVYVESDKVLLEKRMGEPTEPERGRRLRAEIYEKAVSLCERLRASTGNCAIFDLNVSIRAGDTNPQDVRAAATFSNIVGG
jgi:hypothetical protein